MATSLKGLCTPVQVFVVLAVISTIFYLINMFTTVHVNDPIDPGSYLYKNMINMYSSIHVVETQNPSDLYLKTVSTQHGYMALLVKIVLIILFGYLLQVLCKNRLDNVAWIVLFLPSVLFAFIMVYAMSMGALAVVRGK